MDTIKTIGGIILIILSIACFGLGGGFILLGIVLDVLGLICLDFDPSNTTTWIFWDF